MKIQLVIILTMLLVIETSLSSNKTVNASHEIMGKTEKNKIELEIVNHENPVVGAMNLVTSQDSTNYQYAITDLDGLAKIEVADASNLKNRIVKISYIGCETYSMPVDQLMNKKVKVNLLSDFTVLLSDSVLQPDVIKSAFEFIPRTKMEHGAEHIPLAKKQHEAEFIPLEE